jgi:hypothetical protein
MDYQKTTQFHLGSYHVFVVPKDACYGHARLKPNTLWVIGHPYNDPPQIIPTSYFIVQSIEFTYCNGTFSEDSNNRNTTKTQPLINALITKEWKVTPHIVIVVSARATMHIPSMHSFELKLNFQSQNKTHLNNLTQSP